MKILMLGGTVFLGRHIVESLLAGGHEVTLFHRGQRGRELFPKLEHVIGDRDGNLGALEGRAFDAVIDTSGYLPRVVRQSLELLREHASHYTFISSVSAYRDFSVIGITEDAALETLPADATEEIMKYYGGLKAACEGEVQAAFPDSSLIIRPGLIVGPHDPSDRFTYWVKRAAEGGEILAPGNPHRPIQVIDVRDLAEWTVRMVEAGRTGTYNAVGPDGVLSMGEYVDACRVAAGTPSEVTWVDEQFLLDEGVTPWTEMPCWLPELNPEWVGQDQVSVERALSAGLRFRPLIETVRDTLAWQRTRPEDLAPRAGMERAREADLLKEWHARGGAERTD